MKKQFAFLTALALALSVTGCWKGSEKGSTLGVELEYAYISEKADYQTASMVPLASVANGILIGTEDGRSNRLSYWNCETSEFTDMELHNKGKKHGAVSPVNLSGGRFGLIFQKSHYNTRKWDVDAPAYMDIYDSDLQYLDTMYLPEISTGYIDRICSATVDGKDYLLLPCYGDVEQIVIYDLESEEISGTIDTDFSIPVSGSDGEAYVWWTSNGIAHINIAESKLEPINLDFDISQMDYAITGSGEYTMYVYGKQAMYGIKINGSQAEAELVMDFPASDFTNIFILNIRAAPDGRFLVQERHTDSDAFWVTRKRTEEELKNCKVITMAGVDINEELKNTVALYNRSHADYHIVTVDYLDGANAAKGYWSSVGFMDIADDSDDAHLAASAKFQQDLLDGIVPDIICTDHLPYVQFANKGLFLDMTKLMEKDERFREEDYIMNFFDSMKYKGQQQTIAFSFYVNTIAGERKDIGDVQGITPENFTELLKNAPDNYELLRGAESLYSQESYRDNFLIWMQNSFLNTEQVTCSFDSPAFVSLLEIGKALPKEDDVFEYAQTKDGTLLKLEGFSQTFDYHMLQFGDADKTLVGFPTTDGSNGGMFRAPYQLAINAKSEYQDEIWDIFMGMLSDDVQRKLDSRLETYSFPVLRSAFEEDMEASTKGDRIYFNQHYGASSQEEIDFLRNYIENITMFYYVDPTIAGIISEETDKLYAGDQTAQEAASMIQSRASLYLSEQY